MFYWGEAILVLPNSTKPGCIGDYREIILPLALAGLLNPAASLTFVGQRRGFDNPRRASVEGFNFWKLLTEYRPACAECQRFLYFAAFGVILMLVNPKLRRQHRRPAGFV